MKKKFNNALKIIKSGILTLILIQYSTYIISADDSVPLLNPKKIIAHHKGQNSKTEKAAPLAAKHIFSPDPDIDGPVSTNADGSVSSSGKKGPPGNSDSGNPLDDNIKKEMELTGIVITPESKKAMILYKGRDAIKKTPEMYTAGESISGYTIKKIFPNYIVIAQNEREIRLSLFKERDDRPEMPKEPPQISAEAKPEPSQDTQNGDGNDNPAITSNEKETASSGEKSANSLKPAAPDAMQNKTPSNNNPFVKAIQNSENQSVNSSGSSSGTGNMSVNPFLQAIKRARERQQSQ